MNTEHTSSALKKEDCVKILNSAMSEPVTSDIVSRIREAATGRIFLIGGFIYRNLLRRDHGQSDLDFCTDGKIEVSKLRALFEKVEKHRRFDAFKLRQNGKNIDLFELRKFVEIVRFGLPVSIKYYLQYVPFTIQSIAYDIGNSELFDNGALESMANGVIRVNNRRKFNANRKYWLRKGILKAEELGFRFEE